MAKVWFISGATGGFGRLCTEPAVAAGDMVIATSILWMIYGRFTALISCRCHMT